MPTERLYYHDAYQTCFDARVIEQASRDGRPAVILDRTAFYPESGGQRCDTGVLNGVNVVDTLQEDERLLHILDGELHEDRVSGVIDWSRRYDHMRQHTGQHILSETLIRVAGIATESFHMSEQVSSIDISTAPSSPEVWNEVDTMLRDVIQQNLKISTYTVGPDELTGLHLRRTPTRSGPLRIVDIDGFDRTACGGTHCASTGEVQIIQILNRRLKRVHGGLFRLEFVCGDRALNDYAGRIELMSRCVELLGAGPEQWLAEITRLQDSRRASEKKVEELQNRILDYEAERMVQTLDRSAFPPALLHIFPDRSPEDLRRLAQRVVEQAECVALFGGGVDRLQMVFARSGALSVDMGALMKQATARIGGRGGGNPALAMGSAPDVETMRQTLEWAKQALIIDPSDQ